MAMTANAFVEDIHDALESGMDAHVAKSVDMKLLKKTIKKYKKQIIIYSLSGIPL